MSEDLQPLRQFTNFFAFRNYFLTCFYEESCYVNAFPEQQIYRLTATCNNHRATLANQLIPTAAQPATSNNGLLSQQCNTAPSSPQPGDYFESFSYSSSFHISLQLSNCCKCSQDLYASLVLVELTIMLSCPFDHMSLFVQELGYKKKKLKIIKCISSCSGAQDTSTNGRELQIRKKTAYDQSAGKQTKLTTEDCLSFYHLQHSHIKLERKNKHFHTKFDSLQVFL